jgi:hypothetical protein
VPQITHISRKDRKSSMAKATAGVTPSASFGRFAPISACCPTAHKRNRPPAAEPAIWAAT